MLKTLVFVAAMLPGAARAACEGHNLIDAMPEAGRQELAALVAAQPYGQGILWRATKGKVRIDILGTYHLPDPRIDGIVERVAPLVGEAGLLLVEATQEDGEKLRREMGQRPDLMVNNTHPTLPEALKEEEWQKLATALRARGIPPFIAAKFQPWYVNLMLAIAPCAMPDLVAGARGVDDRIMTIAADEGVEIRALEPFDTLFSIFGDLSWKDQIDLMRTALLGPEQDGDYYVTLADSYFREETLAIWEFSRLSAAEQTGLTQAEVDAAMAMMETRLMETRNRRWMEVILPAAESHSPLFIAAGALHLPGEAGLLRLLENAGFVVERVPL